MTTANEAAAFPRPLGSSVPVLMNRHNATGRVNNHMIVVDVGVAVPGKARVPFNGMIPRAGWQLHSHPNSFRGGHRRHALLDDKAVQESAVFGRVALSRIGCALRV